MAKLLKSMSTLSVRLWLFPHHHFATYRFRNIPAYFDRRAFESVVVPVAEETEAVVQCALSPDSYSASIFNRIGTIIFNAVPRYIAQLDLTRMGAGQNAHRMKYWMRRLWL